jgi:hypothetical protein
MLVLSNVSLSPSLLLSNLEQHDLYRRRDFRNGASSIALLVAIFAFREDKLTIYRHLKITLYDFANMLKKY